MLSLSTNGPLYLLSFIAVAELGCGSANSVDDPWASSNADLSVSSDAGPVVDAGSSDDGGGAVGATFLARLEAGAALVGSTVPANVDVKDVHPSGVAFVPKGFPTDGSLLAGDILVSNLNAAANQQAAGTTIVRLQSDGSQTMFFQDVSTPGLSTALAVLRSGFVVVGNVPSSDGSGVCVAGGGGTPTNVDHGSLSFLDDCSRVVTRLTSPTLLNGPWGIAVRDEGPVAQVFVSDVLSGTVTRLDLHLRSGVRVEVEGQPIVVEAMTQIASGYAHRCDPAAFVVGPTGLALDAFRDVLYVASTADNAIFAIYGASRATTDGGMGRLVVSDPVHLHGPLGLARTADGHLLSVQGDAVNFDAAHPGEIVEFSFDGRFVGEFPLDPIARSASGLALSRSGGSLRFAAVDDAKNAVDVWDIEEPGVLSLF